MACSVQTGLSRERINERLDEAIRRAKNGVVHLKESSISAPAETWPADSIVRSPEGVTVTLHCKGGNPVPVGTEQKPQIWLNGRQKFTVKSETMPFEVQTCSCLVDSIDTPFSNKYTVALNNPSTGEMIIELLSFSHVHAGKYDCRRYNGSSFLTTETFFFSPTVTPAQVFQPPMRNVTVIVGDTARFPCYVKFIAMPGDFGDRFLWRNEDHVIYADGFKEFQTGRSTMTNFRTTVHIITDGFCHCHSTLEILRVQPNHAGRYQCWFKVDDVFQEWIVQDAYLIVLT
ncbi:uncharacterized protein LOC129582833 [Paramacrobiotus metropolitanus]|uniref:uncharacterized protein LOC129582833 n=1 Tax=Paramacrobiotus metropolitanus TaxID=2943436 RepID=UPI0024465355|nr:uncharacterized protein LOC129582833 [Paramacrobiotus metropolitanus]